MQQHNLGNGAIIYRSILLLSFAALLSGCGSTEVERPLTQPPSAAQPIANNAEPNAIIPTNKTATLTTSLSVDTASNIASRHFLNRFRFQTSNDQNSDFFNSTVTATSSRGVKIEAAFKWVKKDQVDVVITSSMDIDQFNYIVEDLQKSFAHAEQQAAQKDDGQQ